MRDTLVDLDAEVINACKKSLNRKGFRNKRLKLCIGDAFFFLEAVKKEKGIKFDGIVCDLTDAPIGRKKREEFENFYRQIIIDSHKILKRGGWISIQAGASNTNGCYLNAVGIIEKILNRKFCDVTRSNIQIPSYGEKWAFLFGRKK